MTDPWECGEGSRAAPHSRATDLELPEPAWEADRYELGPVLGFGGMGQVRVAWDRLLQRQVALKEPGPGADAARLAHEAAITARLDHPGIVPIHDLGQRPGGGTFYIMRLVRGRSLAAALGAASGGSGGGSEASGGRLKPAVLLRALLAVCEAVASAHEKGVVHRDLKPGNIMMGPFGEVQVVDWGLAWAPDLPVPRSESGEGTPTYMSPQQAAAQPPAPTDDVYSLGRMLAEVGVGGPELAALIARATADRAEDRYPNAGALAADLARFLDGRRVEAFHYRPLDLLGRLVRAWRVPLAVAGVALAVLGVLGVLGLVRLRRERDRAVAAEATAEEALGRALLGQARAAHRAGERPEAELLAAGALVRGQEAEATGVLLDLAGEQAVQVGPASAWPGCADFFFSESGRFALCIGTDGRLRVGPVEGGHPWSRTQVRHAFFLGDAVAIDAQSGRFTLHAGATGAFLRDLQPASGHRKHTSLGLPLPGSTPERLAFYGHDVLALGPLRHAFPPRLRPCGTERIAGGRLSADVLVVVCAAGQVRRFNLPSLLAQAEAAPGGVFAPRGFTEQLSGVTSVSAWIGSPDGGAFVGNLAGEVVALDAAGRERGRLRSEGAVHDLQLGPAGLFVRNDHLRVRLADPEHLRWLADLGTWRAFRAAPDGTHHTFDGTHHRRLALGPPAATRFETPSGLSSAVEAAGQLALLRGDGTFTLYGLPHTHLGDWPLGGRPLKAAQRLDGLWYVTTSPPDGGLMLVRPGHPVLNRPAAAARRLVPCPQCPGGGLLALRYGGGLDHHTPTATQLLLPPNVWPTAIDASEDGAFVLDDLGTVRRLGGEVVGAPQPMVTAIDHAQGRLARLSRDEVVIEDLTGRTSMRFGGFGSGLDVALALDRPLVAVGNLAGEVHLFDALTGARRAVLPLHKKRVGAVSFSPGHLISAGWDGLARRIPLDLLDLSPTQRVALVEARWGRSAQPTSAGAPTR